MFRLSNFTVFLLLFSLGSCLGEGEVQDHVMKEATRMGDALVNKDFDTYTDLTAEWVQQYMGGKNAMKESVKRIVNQFELKGKRFSRVHYELISDIKEHKGYYQCLLQQVSTISSDYADTDQEAIVLAVSEDSEHWTFAEITYLPKSKLKELVPYLRDDLKNPNWEK